MALLPPPDIYAAYVDTERRPTKDFYNWIRSIYDYTRGLTVGGGGGGGGPLFTPSVQVSSGVGNPASTAETTLFSYTLPANSVTTVGSGLTIKAAGWWGGDSRQAAIRVYFGSFVYSLLQSATDSTHWAAEIRVVMSALAPTRQMIIGTGQASFLCVPLAAGPTAIDMTSPVLIKVTGQGPGAAIANEAVCFELIVEPLVSDIAAAL